MAATAIKRTSATGTVLAVYVSRDGRSVWKEVPAWPATGLQPGYDPQVVIDNKEIIHASGIATTTEGARAVYTLSRDQGTTWSPARVVTPFPAPFRFHSEDKDCLTVADDGTIYIVFNQILTKPREPRGMIVARSTDQGRTWITRDTGAGGFPNGIVTGPFGAVTVTFIIGPPYTYGTVTSADGGDTWKTPVTLGNVNLTEGLSLPSMVRDSRGRVIVADLDGRKPQIKISVERHDGTLERQWQLPLPNAEGRLILPVIADSPQKSPAFQIACKVDPTPTTAGRMTVWLYSNVDDHNSSPVLVTRFPLPAGAPSDDPFAQRFSDGGDYGSFTWSAKGWLSMWVDGRIENGPGQLRAVPMTPID